LALRASVEGWSKEEVAGWLEQEGFGEEWQGAFAANEIDGEALKLLKDPAFLDTMGVPKPVGVRLKFWQKLDALLAPAEEATSSVAAAAQLETGPGPEIVASMTVEEAEAMKGESMKAVMDSDKVEALVADERRFIDSMCELLVDLDAKDRDVALLLDLKENLQLLFSVVVVGEFNAGKSSLINAILGSKFCQEGVVPTTTTINMLRFGEGEESGNTKRNKDYVEMFLPVDLLKQVTVVDTPGTNAIIKEQTKLTKGFIPQSDLIVFVTSAERPITETEGKLLDYIREWGKKVVIVLNKVDLFNEDEESINKVKDFVAENAGRILGMKPPVFAVAGRLALQSKLAKGGPNSAELWRKSRFEELENYIVTTLTNKKEAARVKLESPLGVADRFLSSYEQASRLGGQITEDDKEVLRQLKASLDAFDQEVEAELQSQIARMDALLNKAQERAKQTAATVLSAGYITTNLIGCLTKSGNIQSELKMAMDVDMARELEALVQDFGRVLDSKQNAQWSLCASLVQQRLKSRQWRNIQLEQPKASRALQVLSIDTQGTQTKIRSSLLKQYDPAIETVVIGQAVAQKAFDAAVATSAVAGGGFLALEVFNAGFLDALAFLSTSAGLAYSLGVYPSMLQDEVAADIDSRAMDWKEALKENLEKLFREAAAQSMLDMELSFSQYVDAVAVEESKWANVRVKVKENKQELEQLRKRLRAL